MMFMKNLRPTTAQDQKRSSSIITRVLTRQRGGVGTSDSIGSYKSIGGVDAATEHTMLSTPYSLTRPAVLT